MELETAKKIYSNNATEADIEIAFQNDRGRGEFAILTKEDGSFLQAAGGLNGPFLVEYRDADSDKQFMSIRELTKSETKEVFLEYLRGDDAWITTYEWKELETKKGCADKASIFLLCLSTGIATVFTSI